MEQEQQLTKLKWEVLKAEVAIKKAVTKCNCAAFQKDKEMKEAWQQYKRQLQTFQIQVIQVDSEFVTTKPSETKSSKTQAIQTAVQSEDKTVIVLNTSERAMTAKAQKVAKGSGMQRRRQGYGRVLQSKQKEGR